MVKDDTPTVSAAGNVKMRYPSSWSWFRADDALHVDPTPLVSRKKLPSSPSSSPKPTYATTVDTTTTPNTTNENVNDRGVALLESCLTSLSAKKSELSSTLAKFPDGAGKTMLQRERKTALAEHLDDIDRRINATKKRLRLLRSY